MSQFIDETRELKEVGERGDYRLPGDRDPGITGRPVRPPAGDGAAHPLPVYEDQGLVAVIMMFSEALEGLPSQRMERVGYPEALADLHSDCSSSLTGTGGSSGRRYDTGSNPDRC